MQLSDLFPYSVDPESVSVYIGRVIELDKEFSSNGILYVDIIDPDSEDVDQGAKQSNQAQATMSVRTCYNAWENPPEIKSKTQFSGGMYCTSSGDFHLQNYTFDMQTLAWFTTVSTALNALGIVNVPPVLFSMDITPFPSQAVSIDLKTVLEEFINDLLDSFLRDLEVDSNDIEYNSDSLTTVINNVISDLNGNPYTGLDIATKISISIVKPIKTILNLAFTPYNTFLECINLLLQLIKKRTGNIADLTIPVVTFASEGLTEEDILSYKESIFRNIDSFSSYFPSAVIPTDYLTPVIEGVYNSVQYLNQTMVGNLTDVIVPLREQIRDVINSYLRRPLLDIADKIAMVIQPLVVKLPTVVQLVIKVSLKRLFQVILGIPIKKVLKSVAEQINSLLTEPIEAIVASTYNLIDSIVTSLVNPLIKEIQQSISDIIPFFKMEDIKTLLQDWNNTPETEPLLLPDGSDFMVFLDDGTGSESEIVYFDDINWSDTAQVIALIVALISTASLLTSTEKETLVNTISSCTTSEDMKDIFIMSTESGGWYPLGALSKLPYGSFKLTISNSSGVEEDILPGDEIKEGFAQRSSYIFYEEFLTKEEFLPFFKRKHKQATNTTLLSVTFPGVEVKTCITNNAHFIDVDYGEFPGRYIVNDSPNPMFIFVEPGKVVALKPDGVYYSKTVPHIQINEQDPPVGDDLIPFYYYDGDYPKAIELEVPATDSQGNLLYELGFDIAPYSSTDRLTFDQIAQLFYTPKFNESYTEQEIIEDLVNILNSNTQPDPQPLLYQTILYKCLIHLDSRTLHYDGKIVYPPLPDHTPVVEATSLGNPSVFYFASKLLSQRPFIAEGRFTDIRIWISLNRDPQNPQYYTSDGYSITVEYPVEKGIVDKYWENEEGDPTKLSYLTVVDSNKLACWMSTQIISSTPLSVNTTNDSKIELMSRMLLQVINSLSLPDFNPSQLISGVLGVILDRLDVITNVMDSLIERIKAFIAALFGNIDINTILSALKSITSIITKVSETITPAMKAIVKAVSSVPLPQTCTMTQSAKGKDFSFSSGDNYDLSTTTDSKSQLPYCSEMDREHFLDTNTKVLVLAVGAGKQNLYVIDVLR